MSKQDNTAARILLSVALIAVAMAASYALLHAGVPGPCMCQPTPTPAPCCKADECRQGFSKVDARFGGVWDELVEVQEQLAKIRSDLDAQVDAFLRHRHQDLGEARPGPPCSPMPKCHADCKCTSRILPDGNRTTYKNGCACKCDLCRCSEPACSDKPACECRPQQTIKLPVHRVLKRCK